MRAEPPAWAPGPAQAAALLEEAADLLVLHRDFAAAVERCEAGCDSLGPGPGPGPGPGHESFAEVKCSLCVVGIQALAEMNRWREVLSWVLQYYHVPEHLPPKVLELCILLYSKVTEPQAMLEVGSSWLGSQANQRLPEFGSLLELYLAQVLLPLGRFGAAEELLRGCAAMDNERRLQLLGTIGESRRRWARREEETRPGAEEQQDPATETLLGVLSQKLLTMLTLLRRALRSMSNHFYLLPYKKMLLATFLLYLVVVRLDPASPTSLPFIYKLVQLFRQAWAAVLSPIHRPPIGH
ncbi:peroxisome assembly protein 26 [Camarhynchus parvulus]|uniref:peroxisome assembly protein 26 n=1 Tax=Geospiza parvula TaxID=87175 RepID=UPI0012382473|nr:peroxisome assembly protein 26 [Camarhynchus parvulus]